MRALAATTLALGFLGLAGAALSPAGTADVYGDSLIHADAARALGYTGKGVTVAILDTGIDDRNPAFAASVVAEHCIVPPDGCPGGTAEADGPGSAQDDQGHGTVIADIVAGSGAIGPSGVAPDAKLVVVKVADDNGRTTSGQIAAGLDWVRTHHPEARIVNVSLAGDIPLSGDCSGLTSSLQAYAASVDSLRAQGTLVFAAAGNNGAKNGIPAPACFPETVAVGAVYSRSFGAFTAQNVCKDPLTQADLVACFSNSSGELDLLAAGAPVDAIGIASARAPIAGTSAASAQAAGAAALLLQADPDLTADGLESLLERTGAPVGDPRTTGRETPRIDLAAALTELTGKPVSLPPPPPSVGGSGTPPLSRPTVPSAAVSATKISFGSVRAGSTARRRLVVSNTGSGKLAVRLPKLPSWLEASPGRLRVAASRRATIVLTFRPVRRGSFRSALRISTDDPDWRTIVVTVSGTARS